MSLWTSPSVTAQGNSYSQSRCYPGLSAPSVTHTRIRERQVARQEMGAMEGALNVALSGGKGKKGCGSESRPLIFSVWEDEVGWQEGDCAYTQQGYGTIIDCHLYDFTQQGDWYENTSTLNFIYTCYILCKSVKIWSWKSSNMVGGLYATTHFLI